MGVDYKQGCTGFDWYYNELACYSHLSEIVRSCSNLFGVPWRNVEGE